MMAYILSSCISLGPSHRANFIEDSEEIESAYRTATLQGDSVMPENAEDEVDFSYVRFVKSLKTGHILTGIERDPSTMAFEKLVTIF